MCIRDSFVCLLIKENLGAGEGILPKMRKMPEMPDFSRNSPEFARIYPAFSRPYMTIISPAGL
ncbi:MAG: hypothetical protein MPK62_15100, partial [Alphaproteobacteria bacterium]|nr:hypothetical protein [Alphaproteobacteria bacterium]